MMARESAAFFDCAAQSRQKRMKMMSSPTEPVKEKAAAFDVAQ
jgi:hypothetical protein